MPGDGDAQLLIRNLLTSKNGLVKKTGDELLTVRHCPEIITALWKLLTTANDVEMRKLSANLLRQRLIKFKRWRMVAPGNEELRDSDILTIIIREPNDHVRQAIIHLLADLIRIEAKSHDLWMASLVNEICENCCAADLNLAMMMANVFRQLLKSAREHFEIHIVTICQMYETIFLKAMANDRNAKAIICIIFETLGKMLPAIRGAKSTKARAIHKKLMQHILRLLKDFTLETRPGNFLAAMHVLEQSFCIMPESLKSHLKDTIDFCADVVLNVNGTVPVLRTTALTLIAAILFNDAIAIMKVNKMEAVLSVFFDVLAEADDCENDTAYFNGFDTRFDGSQQRTLMSFAARAMYALPRHRKLDAFREVFVEMLKRKLMARDPHERYAAYLCLGLIIEHTISEVPQKYFFSALKCIESGLLNSSLIVRTGAIFAFNQLSLHLTHINLEFCLRRLFPIVDEAMEHFCRDLESTDRYTDAFQHKRIERILYCFYWYFNVLEMDMRPYLAHVVGGVMRTLNRNYPPHVQGHSLTYLASLFSVADNQLMMRWLPHIVLVLHGYFSVDNRVHDILALRGHAVNLLTAMTKGLSQQQFAPMLERTKTYAVALLATTTSEECGLKADLYRLIAELSVLLGDELQDLLPKIISSMLETIANARKRLDENYSQEERRIQVAENSNRNDCEKVADERLQNIIADTLSALTSLLENAPNALTSYLNQLVKATFHLLNHQMPLIRHKALDLLQDIIIMLFNKSPPEGETAEVLCDFKKLFVPKALEMVAKDREPEIVVDVLRGLFTLWQAHAEALCSFEEMAFERIVQILDRQIASLRDNRTATAVAEGSAFEIFNESVKLSKHLAAISVHFPSYFPKLASAFIKELHEDGIQARRCIIYDALQHSIPLLKARCQKHFGQLCPVLLKGMRDQMADIRFYAIQGLGNLVYSTKERSYGHFPDILEALTAAMQAERCYDILFEMCLTLVKIIVTNPALVPLQHALPYLMRIILPKDGVLCCNSIGMECFDLLYSMKLEELYPYLGHVVHSVMLTNKKPCRCHKSKIQEITKRLFRNMLDNYPKEYENINKMAKYTTGPSNR